jgi:hypothetical protein
LGFSASGPLLLGIGFVPIDRITAAGKADTTSDPGYFFQVKDAPLGGSLPLMINHKRAYEEGARFYQVMVDGVIKFDTWSNYEWDSGTTRFDLCTISPIALAGGMGFYPVRNPDRLWLNAWLGDLLNTLDLTNTLHTITINFADGAGNVLFDDKVTVLINNQQALP